MKRNVAVIAAVVLLAGLMTVWNVPLASSQGTTLTVEYVSDVVPWDDPAAPIWQKATPVDVPLSAQYITVPGGGSLPLVKVRALRDSKRAYFLLEWQDASEDLSAARVQSFADAAALQFPTNAGNLPFFCMGQRESGVNIWQWRADWQRATAQRQEMKTQYPSMQVNEYPLSDDKTFPANAGEAAGNLVSLPERQTPVQNLMAKGFGTLAPASIQRVQGWGRWQKGTWQVIFSRELATGQREEAQLRPGAAAGVAFAIWEGSRQERDGMKSTSSWVGLQLKAEPGKAGASGTLVLLLMGVGGIIVVALILGLLPTVVKAKVREED